MSWSDLDKELQWFQHVHVQLGKEFYCFQGVQVQIRKELYWFQHRRRCARANEPGIAIVSVLAKVSWCDLVLNYSGFGAFQGVLVRLS